MPVAKRLPHRLGIILPSRDRRGGELDLTLVRGRIKGAVEDWFGEAFGGSTEDRVQVRPRLRGRWAAEGGVVMEEVEEIWAYCTAAEFRRQRPRLVKLAEWVATEADQEAVAILVDAAMELVVGREKR